MIGERVLAIGRQEGGQFLALLAGEAGAHADVLQVAGIIEEPEEERPHVRARAVLVPAEASHHAVAIPLVLHLEHDALVGLVPDRDRFGHDAIEAGAFEAAEPIGGDVRLAGRRSEVNGRGGVGEQFLQAAAAILKGLVAEIAIAFAEEIEEDHGGGDLAGKQFDARGGGMEAQLEGVEIQAGVPDDDDLAIEHGPGGEGSQKGRDEFREISIERLLFAALDENLVVIAEDECAEAVPFGLEDPVAGLG